MSSMMRLNRVPLRRVARVFVAAILTTLATTVAAAAQAASPEAILTRYARTIDPDHRLASLQGLRMVSEMEFPGMGTATMTTLQGRPDKMLITTMLPGLGEIKQGFDGTTAWSNDPMSGPRILSDAEATQLRDGANFDAIGRALDLFSTMEPAGEVTVGGEVADCLKLTWKTKRVTTECYSRSSGLLVETRVTGVTAQGEVEAVSHPSDYREVGGVKLPHRIEQNIAGTSMVITIKEAQAGPVDADLLELPAEIKALKKP